MLETQLALSLKDRTLPLSDSWGCLIRPFPSFPCHNSSSEVLLQDFLLAVVLAHLGLALHQHDVGDDRSLEAPRRLPKLSCAQRPCWSRSTLQQRTRAGRDESRGTTAHHPQEGRRPSQGEEPNPLSPQGPQHKIRTWLMESGTLVDKGWFQDPEKPALISLSPKSKGLMSQTMLPQDKSPKPGSNWKECPLQMVFNLRNIYSRHQVVAKSSETQRFIKLELKIWERKTGG